MKLYSFKIEPAVADALKAIKESDGIGESEQIRRGIDLWLESRGKTRKRAGRKPKR